MTNLPINFTIQKLQLKESRRKFQRTRDKQSNSTQRKTLSQCGSETKLHRFYVHSSKINNLQRTPEKGDNILGSQQAEDFDFPKVKLNKKIVNPQQDCIKNTPKKCNQQEWLREELQSYKEKNQQLQLKLQAVTKALNDYVRKQNKPMNKMRDNIQKERITQLQTQNKNLKSTIQQLKQQINQAKNSRITEQTLSCVEDIETWKSLQSLSKMQGHLEYNEQAIVNLNDTVKRLQLQMDFINRKSYSEIALIKINYQKEFKAIKDKFSQVLKSNNELKRKNTQLVYKIKSFREPKCTKCRESRNTNTELQRNESLLSLSSD